MSKILNAFVREKTKYCMGLVETGTLHKSDTRCISRNAGNSRVCLGCLPCPGVLKRYFLSRSIKQPCSLFSPTPFT